MTDQMALEALAEQHARLNGYLTIPRVPFMVQRSGKKHASNTDFDVLGFNPRDNTVMLAEVKGWGSPDDYPNYNTPTYRKILLSLAKGVVWDWQVFVQYRGDSNAWRFKRNQLDLVRIVFPGSFDGVGGVSEDDALDEFRDEVSGKVRKSCHQSVTIGLWPVNKMIVELLRLVKDNKGVRRVRYHDTALEAFRWLTRRPELHRAELSQILWNKSGGG